MPTTQGETFRFLLLGKTGCGKSSTGNTILGQELFDADVSFQSVTNECQLQNATNLGVSFEIMDSPGLFDTGKTHEEISTLVMQAVACMHPGPDAIFYVIKLGRYTEEEYGVYNRLKALFDDNVTKFVIVIFTHGDNLKGKTIEDVLIKMPKTLNEVLTECSHRYLVFDNRTQNKNSQVLQLVNTVIAMKAANGGEPYQCPKYATVGEKLEEEVNKRLAKVEESEVKMKKYVQELTSQLDEAEEAALKEKDEFEKKDRERQEAMKQKEEMMQKQLGDLAETLKQQQLSEDEQRKQMEILLQRQTTERQQFQDEMQRQRQQHAEEVQRREQNKDEAMKALLAQMEANSKAAQERYVQEMQVLKQQIANSRQKSDKCTIL